MKVEIDTVTLKAIALHLDDYVRNCTCMKMNSFKYAAEHCRKLIEEMIIEQFFNELAFKERQEKWDRRYLEMARLVSTWSKDPSTQVGAVLVNHQWKKEFVGYNGFPVGVNDTSERYSDRELKYKLVVHAESNAIRKAGDYAAGSTLYVYPAFSLPPICNECAKDAIQAGVREVVGYEPDLNDPRVQRWLEAIKISQMMFEEAGVKWRSVKE